MAPQSQPQSKHKTKPSQSADAAATPPDLSAGLQAIDPKLRDTAAFLAPTARQTRVNDQSLTDPAALHARTIAEVDSDNPYQINVQKPAKLTAPIASHELTHVYQLSRDSKVPFVADPVGTTANPAAIYNYGGPAGLLAARAQGRTMHDYGREQQAAMVEDYQRETQSAIKRGDGPALDKLKQAYEPFVQELARLPAQDQSWSAKADQALGTDIFSRVRGMVAPSKLDANVTAPADPVATAGVTGGQLVASPLIGGSATSANRQPPDLTHGLQPINDSSLGGQQQ